jgi:hypothetical protein
VAHQAREEEEAFFDLLFVVRWLKKNHTFQKIVLGIGIFVHFG